MRRLIDICWICPMLGTGFVGVFNGEIWGVKRGGNECRETDHFACLIDEEQTTTLLSELAELEVPGKCRMMLEQLVMRQGEADHG